MRPYDRAREALQPEDLDYADALARRARGNGTTLFDRAVRSLLAAHESRPGESAPQVDDPEAAEPTAGKRRFKSAA